MNRTIFHQQIFPVRHKLYRFALRITGNVHDAEDVVQEVLEKVWKTSPEQTCVVQNWEAWCMKLTKNRALDKISANANRKTTGTATLENLPQTTPQPDHSVETRDMAEQIRGLIQSLPEKYRLVMHLRDIEELSYEEIAQTLEISMDQVKTNLHRARKAVREQMIKNTHSADLFY